MVWLRNRPFVAGSLLFNGYNNGGGSNFGDAVRLRLVNAALQTQLHPLNSVLATVWTIDGWVQVSTSNNSSAVTSGANTGWTGSDIVVDWDVDGANNGGCGIGFADGRLTCGIGNTDGGGSANNYSLTGTTDVRSATNWVHFRVVRNGQALYLYIDGAEEASELLTGVTGSGNIPLDVSTGGQGQNEYFVVGREKHGYTDGLRGGIFEIRVRGIADIGTYTVPAENTYMDTDQDTVLHWAFGNGEAIDLTANGGDGEVRVEAGYPQQQDDYPWAA